MSNFGDAFDYVVGREGFFTKDPDDKGNWTGGKVGVGVLKGTKFGISAAAYPTLDIEALTLEDVRDIYFKDYWQAAGCDRVSPGLGLALFDGAVNQGVKTAVQCLQRAAGVTDDGWFGQQTSRAVGRLDPLEGIERFMAERILEYVQAGTWEKYKLGWMRRAIGTAVKATR